MYEVLILKQERYILNLKKKVIFFLENFCLRHEGLLRDKKSLNLDLFLKHGGKLSERSYDFFFEMYIPQDLKNVVNDCFGFTNKIEFHKGTKSMVHPDGTQVSVFLTVLKISQEKCFIFIL